MTTNDLSILKHQEEILQFDFFNEDIAWQLGSIIYERGKSDSLPIVIEIKKFDQPLFLAARSGVTFDHHDWIRRKGNSVQRFLRSSYRLGHELSVEKLDITQRYNLPADDYSSAGGGFPIIVKNIGVIGSIAVSGLPERQDHQLIVGTLADYLRKDKKSLQLSETS